MDRTPQKARLRRACLAAVSLAGSAALAAGCSSGSPGSGAAANPTSSSSAVSRALKYSQCMRSHGISDFPDPDSNGQITLTLKGPNSDLASTNPKFEAAEAACKSLQPTEGGTQAQQEQNYAAELEYAHCMQSHGEAVPDPKAPGSGSSASSSASSSSGNGVNGNGPNPNSPQYIAANKACQHYLPAGTGPSTSNGGGS